MNKRFLIGLFAINSLALVAQTEVLNEDFDSGSPVAFTIVDNDGMTPDAATAQFTEAWTRIANPDNPSDTVMGSTSYFDPTGTASRWLITPSISLGSYGNYFYWNARSHDPSFPDDYLVLISTTDTQISSFTDTIGLIQEEFATWQARSINLSSNGYGNQSVHIAFVNNTDDGFALYIDDVRAEIDDPVGIDEIGPIAISVYPNPTSDLLKIAGVDVEKMEIVSLNGEILLVGHSSELNVSTLSAGTYLVKVQSTQGIGVETFVKK